MTVSRFRSLAGRFTAELGIGVAFILEFILFSLLSP